MTLPDEIAAAARRVGENVGHSLAQEREGNNCDGCRAERAALAEITALIDRAVREELEACALIAENYDTIGRQASVSSAADWCAFAVANAIRSRIEPARGGE